MKIKQTCVLIFSFLTIKLFAEAKKGRQGKIIGGDIINIQQAPFMVALEYLDKQICGGAIVSEYWIVTASHCFGLVFLTSQALIRVGAGMRHQGGSVHYIAELHEHPGFVIGVNDNDVALIKVFPAFQYTDSIQPIAVSNSYLQPQDGEYVTVYGYGYTREEGDPSEYLRCVSVPVFPHAECVEIYKTTLNVTWQMFCAGYRDGGRDACVLDSGGPMVWNNVLHGLVSWGYGCARALRPGVFTDLSSPPVRNWIRSLTSI